MFPCAKDHTWGSGAGEQPAFPAPISSGSEAQQLPVSPPTGQGQPLKLGSITVSRKYPHFPTGSSKSGWQMKADVVQSESC